jgi:serpin B
MSRTGNSRKLYWIVGALLAAVVVGSQLPALSDLLSGTTAKEDIPVLDDSGATAASVEATVEGYNGFAFDLYSRYSAGDGNILFSPYSISTALSMTYEGARGETADEMEAVFGFLENPSERLPSVARIYNTLNDVEREYALHTVNALWVQQEYPVLEEYVEAIVGYYGGDVNALDFVADPEESRVTINEWVEERTNDRIKDLFPSGSIDGDVRLVLTNAIYFKGDWLYEFNEDATSEEEFHVSPTTTVTVDMMSLRDETFNYVETDDLQILELPYTGEDVSMLILLPREGYMGEVEAQLSAESLGEWIGLMEATDVNVQLPRFTFETKYFMMDDLAEMGMPTAFTGAADFSGMNAEDQLYIDMVIHQAFIEVNEKGTEAAAATGVSMRLSAAAPPQTIFNADHPFVFLIRDVDTGLIMFMGRVSDPS